MATTKTRFEKSEIIAKKILTMVADGDRARRNFLLELGDMAKYYVTAAVAEGTIRCDAVSEIVGRIYAVSEENYDVNELIRVAATRSLFDPTRQLEMPYGCLRDAWSLLVERDTEGDDVWRIVEGCEKVGRERYGTASVQAWSRGECEESARSLLAKSPDASPRKKKAAHAAERVNSERRDMPNQLEAAAKGTVKDVAEHLVSFFKAADNPDLLYLEFSRLIHASEILGDQATATIALFLEQQGA